MKRGNMVGRPKSKFRIEQEKQFALVALIQELLDQIDEIAVLRAMGKEARVSKSLLAECASVLPQLDEESREAYYEFLLAIAPLRESSSRLEANSYSESVRAAKEAFIDKIHQDLEAA